MENHVPMPLPSTRIRALDICLNLEASAVLDVEELGPIIRCWK